MADDDDAKGDLDDAADLGDRSERVDESHSSYKQRMLRQRIEQAQAEVKVAQQQLASYRAYQQREVDEVRPQLPHMTCNPSLQLPEYIDMSMYMYVEGSLLRLFDDCRQGLRMTPI